MYEKNTKKIGGRHSSTIIVGDFSLHFQRWIEQLGKSQQGNRRLEQDYEPRRSNRHLQDTQTQNSRISVLLKCTWNILQKRQYDETQNKCIEIEKV